MNYEKSKWYYDLGLYETLSILDPSNFWFDRIKWIMDFTKIQPMSGPVGAIFMLGDKDED